jgi:hypothetical protein
VTLLQLAPMLPPEGAQFDPLQQRLGSDAVWGVHVRLGAQPPAESQRQPCDPTMHVEGAPAPPPPAPELEPVPPPDVPELPPTPLEPLEPLPPDDRPPSTLLAPGVVDDEPPHPQNASKIDRGAPTAAGVSNDVGPGMTLLVGARGGSCAQARASPLSGE